MPAPSFSTLGRYLLFQLPGFLVAGLVLAGLVRFFELPLVGAAALFGLWVAKDLALYPFMKVAYEPRRKPDGAEALVGCRGVTQDAVDPEGYVRIGHELWRARLAEEEPPIGKGASVRVVQVHDLSVVVRAENGVEGNRL